MTRYFVFCVAALRRLRRQSVLDYVRASVQGVVWRSGSQVRDGHGADEADRGGGDAGARLQVQIPRIRGNSPPPAAPVSVALPGLDKSAFPLVILQFLYGERQEVNVSFHVIERDTERKIDSRLTGEQNPSRTSRNASPIKLFG